MAEECELCGKESNLYADMIRLFKDNTELSGKRDRVPVCIDCSSEHGFKEY